LEKDDDMAFRVEVKCRNCWFGMSVVEGSREEEELVCDDCKKLLEKKYPKMTWTQIKRHLNYG
jgi:hypothetical protein